MTVILVVKTATDTICTFYMFIKGISWAYYFASSYKFHRPRSKIIFSARLDIALLFRIECKIRQKKKKKQQHLKCVLKCFVLDRETSFQSHLLVINKKIILLKFHWYKWHWFQYRRCSIHFFKISFCVPTIYFQSRNFYQNLFYFQY